MFATGGAKQTRFQPLAGVWHLVTHVLSLKLTDLTYVLYGLPMGRGEVQQPLHRLLQGRIARLYTATRYQHAPQARRKLHL